MLQNRGTLVFIQLVQCLLQYAVFNTSFHDVCGLGFITGMGFINGLFIVHELHRRALVTTQSINVLTIQYPRQPGAELFNRLEFL